MYFEPNSALAYGRFCVRLGMCRDEVRHIPGDSILGLSERRKFWLPSWNLQVPRGALPT